jgi:DNA-binding transcriptional LysR family regulator
VPWREEEMVLACSPKHAFASRLALPPSELEDVPYVHFDRNLVVRRRVDRFLREQNVSVEVVAEFDSIENIKQAVSIGAGVAILPEPTVRREVKARTLVALPLFGCTFTRPIAIIHRRDQRLSVAGKRFMEMLLEPDVHRNGSAHANPDHKSHGKNGTPARPSKG